MDFSIATNAGTVAVVSTHRLDKNDDGRVNLISGARLAYLLRLEAEHARMLRASFAQRRRGADTTRVLGVPSFNRSVSALARYGQH